MVALVNIFAAIGAIRERAATELASLPAHLRQLETAPPYPVEVSVALRKLAQEVDDRLNK